MEGDFFYEALWKDQTVNPLSTGLPTRSHMLHRLPEDILRHIVSGAEAQALTLPLRHVNRTLRATLAPIPMCSHTCLATPSMARWTLARMRREWVPHPHTVLAKALKHDSIRNIVWAHRPQCFTGRAAQLMLKRAIRVEDREAMECLVQQEIVSIDDLVHGIGHRGNVKLLLWALYAFE